MARIRRAGLFAPAACAALIATALGPVAVCAPAVTWLSDAEIETLLKGRTLDGMYASGRRFTESYLESGGLTYTEDGVTLTGHWSVRSGTLCTIYDTDPTGGCFRVAPMGANCFEFYFVSRSEEAAPGRPGGKPDWTARGAVEGKAEACTEGANV